MILTALALASKDLLRPRIFSVVLLGVLLTLLLLAGLQAGAFWAIRWFAPDTIHLPLIGAVSFSGILSWGSLVLLPVMGFFLMTPVAAAFSGLFAERVALAVEDIHYPAAIGRSLDFWDGLLESLAIMGAAIAILLLSLVLTPFLGPLAPVFFYGANGWLLGREFFAMTAKRHLSAAQAKKLQRKLSLQVTGLGVLIALLLTVPVVNILIPVLAAAGFTHLFHLSQTGVKYPRGSQYRRK